MKPRREYQVRDGHSIDPETGKSTPIKFAVETFDSMIRNDKFTIIKGVKYSWDYDARKWVNVPGLNVSQVIASPPPESPPAA